ncbi:MAG: C-type lectin domain-containing protein, partial [Myxococcota bacterium]
VHTVSPETCNGLDDDCDGATDEADASGRVEWYLDADGDGYGDEADTVEDCDAPDGYAADPGDCDDDDATIHPDATEGCDATDENCDGLIDEDASCPCDIDWYGDSAYLFCETATSWTSAKATCESVGYHLATVGGVAEDDWLLSVARTYSVSAAYWWIGFNDRAREGTWVWDDGSPVTYTRWNAGEPNNSGDEDCTQLTWASAHWNDWACTSSSTYICEAEAE